ncbi:DNA repair protein RecO [Candidatus Oleimmundimicrobium sp.]|uniref:DNA repair protein RecO n=1 Tax=Candidatus Oleimmundimicrobium sp. TaxID=3060597 RepID=UPI002720F69F|nr:DNA repair protein RecO [Candidatus Oleimmundimicrobium sp.]MDO8885836.1 DNA repair protein RecO [Candidatus Oleimmundimicrobium sp.]
MSSRESVGSLCKTKGIVLKSIKLGEADKIITFFTDSQGKISAVAKGLRRTKSKFGGRLEPFTYVDLLLYQGRNLDTITQTEIIDSFSEIREDLNKIAYGFSALDLVNKISVEHEKDRRVFEFLLSSLRTLSKTSVNMDLFLVAFDLKLLSLSGFLPVLSRCVICDKAVSGFEKIFFSCGNGGLVCEKCVHLDYQRGEIESNTIFISPQAADLILILLKARADSFNNIEIPEGLKKEVIMIAKKYVNFNIHAQLKSRDCINKLKD